MAHSGRFLVVWMMAAAIHLPLPVCVGGHPNGGPWQAAGMMENFFQTAEVVLWGTNRPDERDRGPVRAPLEPGHKSPWGALVICASATSLVHPHVQALPVNAHSLDDALLELVVSGHEQSSIDFSGLQLFWEPSSRPGPVVLRC